VTEDMKDIEQHLIHYMNTVRAINPPASTENQLSSGIQKASRKQHWVQTSKIMGLTAAVLLIGFMLLVNFSSTFQKVTADVPVLSDLVKLVKMTEGDTGLQEAIKQGYVQPIHVKDTQNGVTFEVSNIVIDHSRLVLFYNVSTNDERAFVDESKTKIHITNKEGKPLENTIEFNPYKLKGTTHGSGEVDFLLKPGVPITDMIKFKINLLVNEVQSPQTLTFNIDIPINQKLINAKTTYPINKWFNIEGQRLFVRDAVFYPTQTLVHIQFDKANSMKILQFPDIHIEDQDGNTFAQHYTGLLGDDEWGMYLENTHYVKPKTPVLVINKVMTIDKSLANVKVNLHERKIISGPKDILLNDVSEYDKGYELHFTMKAEKDFNSSLLSCGVKDASGKDIKTTSCTSSWDSKMAGVTMDIPKMKYQEPLSFEISGYPNYLDANIRIPLTK
jgi:hypothetical protein